MLEALCVPTDLLVKTLNDLINAMKRLREEVEYQVGGCADVHAQLRARDACDFMQVRNQL